MADLAQVATTLVAVVLGAAIGGILSWVVAREQGRTLLKQVELQHASAQQLQVQAETEGRMREVRERIWKVRSPPLLAFRAELARMAHLYEYLIVVEQMQLPQTVTILSPEARRQRWGQGLKAWDNYVLSGTYVQAMLQLTDEDLLTKARKLWKDFFGLYVQLDPLSPTPFQDVDDMRSEVVTLQQLIATWLLELGGS